MRNLLLALVLVPALGQAQGIVAAVLDSNGPSEATARKAQRSLEAALKALSGAPTTDGPVFRKGAPRSCTSDCAAKLVASLTGSTVALLDLKGSDTRVVFELSVWVASERVGARKGETPPEALDASLKAALEQLLPAWLRKGFGALSLTVEGGSVVKVDGRVLPTRTTEVLAVPSGVHQVDVVFPDGNAVLQRLEVPEAGRVTLSVESPTLLSSRPASGPTALRYTSYGLFMAGAGSLAAGLIAGALSHGKGLGLTACDSPSARTCSTLAEVQQRQQLAQQYAGAGNVLLGVGAGLATLAVSLFIVDVALQ